MLQQKACWKQKSRDEWIALRDQNTVYFHAVSIAKRTKAKILSIQDDLGNTISESSWIRELAQKFFLHLFINDVSISSL